jgi:choice-of-anchor C domain-containing protein
MATVAGLCLATARPAAAGANLLSNGSFETPVQGGDFGTIFSTDPNPTIGAWTVTSGSVDLINTYWTAEDGNQSLDMSGNGPGSIAQTVNTTAGETYQLSFWEAGNTDGGSTVKSLSAIVNGTQIGDALFDDTGKSRSNMGWQQYSYDFTSSGGPTTISFQSNEPSPWGPALDNVSLQAVPEASSVILFGLLLVGGSIVLIRKRPARTIEA